VSVRSDHGVAAVSISIIAILGVSAVPRTGEPESVSTFVRSLYRLVREW
jgi:hypothetical protein